MTARPRPCGCLGEELCEQHIQALGKYERWAYLSRRRASARAERDRREPTPLPTSDAGTKAASLGDPGFSQTTDRAPGAGSARKITARRHPQALLRPSLPESSQEAADPLAALQAPPAPGRGGISPDWGVGSGAGPAPSEPCPPTTPSSLADQLRAELDARQAELTDAYARRRESISSTRAELATARNAGLRARHNARTQQQLAEMVGGGRDLQAIRQRSTSGVSTHADDLEGSDVEDPPPAQMPARHNARTQQRRNR